MNSKIYEFVSNQNFPGNHFSILTDYDTQIFLKIRRDQFNLLFYGQIVKHGSGRENKNDNFEFYGSHLIKQ